ncbi:CaiB/BaiF CoA transferase family protein [Salicibibacter kimchii]|uniref:CoA transferase n=1 Tax=Salicibibacter kimchii TaxID=2099786 RepID=A0A345BWP0_9BACI|nr:CoA transferase [Salicibibacter kimchii]AXF55371.1 CoA transferase [Salicibibacter kimchii]
MPALTGVRVLDFTHYIAGPYCSQILADHGADVIKVEHLEGETGREAEPKFDEKSLYFASQNRNKRALTLNLKSIEGRDIVQRLVETADILVTNYGLGVPERLGIGYKDITSINPEIIMVHITGFGATGPYRDRAAFDGIIQSMSGLADLTGDPEGLPTNVGFYIADHIAGLQGAMGTMLALQSRERTGKGQYVDISMLDGLISMLGYYPGDVLLSGKNHSRAGVSDPRAFASIFPTKDNGFVYIAPVRQPMWENFARMIGRKEWLDPDSPFYSREARLEKENREELEAMISEWTSQHTKMEIVSLLQNEKIPCGPVQTLLDVVHDPQVRERSMIKTVRTTDGEDLPVPGVPIKLNETPANEVSDLPEIGQHSNEILMELGLSPQEINFLKQEKVI